MIDPASIVSLPEEPGCYLFKDRAGSILYIGKAVNLQKRVRSYVSPKEEDTKTVRMVEHIHSLDCIVTDNEVEALILENNLIKKHQPRYNINLKDAKNYAYIRLTAEPFCRLEIARRQEGTGEFFGPFVSAAARDDVLTVLNKTFKLRTCKRMPAKPCLRHHIRLCDAPCIRDITETAYAPKIQAARMILKGQANRLVRQLEAEMKRCADHLDFEHAIELRSRIAAVEGLKEKQKMQRQKSYNEDIINYAIRGGTVYLILFNIYKGILENKQEFTFAHTGNEDVLEEFLVQYYSENRVPGELILPQDIDEALIDFLKTRRNGALQVTVPQRGEKRQLLQLVAENIRVSFLGDSEALADLRRVLHLPEEPEVIECFDISHLAGTATVASMVQFRSGLPDRSHYRRFRIKTVHRIDDFAAIAEVVRRRYTRLLRERQEMPDLVIIDGGAGQLAAALGQLEKLGLTIPTIAIAKRLEEIYLPGDPPPPPLRLNRRRKALKLIQRIRDEAHRFAIAYNRLLRKKELIKKSR
jgi:excinuclease ABC subunit C